MFNRKGEISTIVILGTLVVIGIGALMSSTINQNQRTLDTRAEFDGTSCNDNIGDSLNTSGSTNFNINCWGNLNRSYTYALFWCPEQSKGAAYCGDIRDIEGSKKQATLLDQSEGATLPSNLNKSTDKNCGCVSWHVGIQDANGQIGWAGSAGFCSNSPCDSGENTNAVTPTRTSQPTSPPQQNTPTPTRYNLPNGTSCTTGSTCQSGCCSSGLCNSANVCQNACNPGQTKCIGTDICVDSRVDCPAPTPTRVPTYTQQNDEYPPTRVPTYSQQNDEYPPTVTPTKYNIFIPNAGINDQPTPVPTVIRTDQIQTQNDTIFQSCFDKNGQIVLPLPQDCISLSWEEFIRYLDSL